MTPNLKVLLAAVGVAALAASPAMAKSHARIHSVAPLTVLPADAHGYAGPYAAHPFVTPYAPDLPEQPHQPHGANPDFQLGGEK